MEGLFVVVIAVVLIAIVAAVGQRMHLASPLVLVAIGLLLAAMPFTPDLPAIDPEWILVGVLPPLLYSSAINLPAIEFRRDFTPIAGLSVVLVVISAVILGLFFTWTIPGLSLPLGIALGAILSPTDAVATSIVKRLGISPRVVTMLEGESLLNDATALVLLRTAITAIAAGFSFGSAVGAFLGGVLVALVVGAVVGWANLRVRAWVNNSAANTALSFAAPFIAYVPTDAMGGSGLVAAVVVGIVTGQGAARWLTPEQRLSDRLNWRTVELILEGGVFLIMGLELNEVVDKNLTEHEGLWRGTWLALAALGILLLVRGVYVVVIIWGQGRRADRFSSDDIARLGAHLESVARGRTAARHSTDAAALRRWGESIRRRFTRIAADLDYYRASRLGWKHGAVIVWAGMRGVVTLAAAQTLPTDTPQRELLVFVAFMVALASLMLQGFTLTPLVRALRIRGGGEETKAQDQEDEALQDELRVAAIALLQEPGLRRRDGSPFDPEFLSRVETGLTMPPDDNTTAVTHEALELRLAMIKAMRSRLVDVAASGRYSSAALRQSLAELDADQLSVELKVSGGEVD